MLVIQSIFVEHGLRGWGSVASIASWPRSSWIGDLQFRSASADPSALGQDSVLKQTKLTTVNQYEVERGQATQGIAVDATYFYPISNKLVVKYDKATGQKKDSWKPEQAHQISHLNSGMVHDGKLYLGHSNWNWILPPTIKNSIEIIDCKTMKHDKSIPLPDHGFCNWIDRYGGAWWICYGHYDVQGGKLGTADTILVKYDGKFQELKRWKFPHQVIKSFEGWSASGGSFHKHGILWVTGHSKREIYRLEIDSQAEVLKLIEPDLETLAKGQGIAWDRSRENRLFQIEKNRTVIVSKLE